MLFLGPYTSLFAYTLLVAAELVLGPFIACVPSALGTWDGVTSWTCVWGNARTWLGVTRTNGPAVALVR